MAALTWADLTHSLARHLESMPVDTYFTLYVDDSRRPDHEPDLDGHPLYVQFCAFAEQVVRCEVVSNQYLPADRHHTVDDLVAMRRDGWNLPHDQHVHGSPNLFVDVVAVDADAGAARVMRVFRSVWRVEDPAEIITDAQYLRGPNAFRVLDAPADYPSHEPAA